MVRYVDTGNRFLNIEIFLDDQQTSFVRRVYDRTGYPVGHELREIVKQLGGEWDCLQTPQGYDTLNIPCEGGTLIIERPWIDLKDRSQRGHRVSFDGKFTPGLEESIKAYLSGLHKQERAKSREWFLQTTTIYEKQEPKETAKLFQ